MVTSRKIGFVMQRFELPGHAIILPAFGKSSKFSKSAVEFLTVLGQNAKQTG